MLKIDKKICDKLKNGVGVKMYLKTPSKMGRIIWFDDDTFMTIETKGTEGEMFQKVKEIVKQDLSITHTQTDKDGRFIAQFKLTHS